MDRWWTATWICTGGGAGCVGLQGAGLQEGVADAPMQCSCLPTTTKGARSRACRSHQSLALAEPLPAHILTCMRCPQPACRALAGPTLYTNIDTGKTGRAGQGGRQAGTACQPGAPAWAATRLCLLCLLRCGHACQELSIRFGPLSRPQDLTPAYPALLSQGLRYCLPHPAR